MSSCPLHKQGQVLWIKNMTVNLNVILTSVCNNKLTIFLLWWRASCEIRERWSKSNKILIAVTALLLDPTQIKKLRFLHWGNNLMKMIKIHTRKGIISVIEKKCITCGESPKWISIWIRRTTFQVCDRHFLFLEASPAAFSSELITCPGRVCTFFQEVSQIWWIRLKLWNIHETPYCHLDRKGDKKRASNSTDPGPSVLIRMTTVTRAAPVPVCWDPTSVPLGEKEVGQDLTQLGDAAYLAGHCGCAVILLLCGLCVRVSFALQPPSPSQTLMEPARQAGETCQGANHNSLGRESKPSVRVEASSIKWEDDSRTGYPIIWVGEMPHGRPGGDCTPFCTHRHTNY